MSKLRDDEQEVLLNKYSSMGLTDKQANWRLAFVLNSMVISSLTFINC